MVRVLIRIKNLAGRLCNEWPGPLRLRPVGHAFAANGSLPRTLRGKNVKNIDV